MKSRSLVKDSVTMVYNPNGSITSLQRNGMKNNGTFGAIDNLTITYDGNQLVKVTDTAEALNYDGALDFHDGDDSTSEYDYDSNGALTRDSNRGINSITYDYGHHAYYINMNMNSRPRNITNDYTPDGSKLLSKHVISIPKVNGFIKKTITDKYVDGLMLRGDTTLLWRFDGGYVDLNANGTPTSWNYYITDHLGSTRMVVDSNDSIRETINYYPFGSEMRISNPAQMSGDTSHPFRFTGKELDRMNSLNMYDFGARWYDVAGVPMWTSVDPFCEKYYNVSPYMYCEGDPVNMIDPDGQDWFFYSIDGHQAPTWNWRDEHEYHTGQYDSSGNEIILLGQKAVIDVQGYYDECLGKGDNLFGEGAKLAEYTVYGPNGQDDIQTYRGLTMSSDFNRYGAIDNGEYTVSYDAVGKYGTLKSHWAINKRGAVNCLDGVNPSPLSRYSETQKSGIFIHTSNQSGYAGWGISKKNGKEFAISSGCLLIVPSGHNENGWDEFNKQLRGVKSFKLYLNRR